MIKIKVKRVVSLVCAAALAASSFAFDTVNAKAERLKQQELDTITSMPDSPSGFKCIDWAERGRKLDGFLFDYSATDLTKNTVDSVSADRDYSTIYKDDKYGGYMIPAFYGEDRPLNNADDQESIAVTSALIASSLLGIDKNVPIPEGICGDQKDSYLYQLLGEDTELTYLDSALKFYWTKENANVFTNVPNGSESLLQNKPGVYQAFGDYWYMIIANQNFFRLAALNPNWRTDKILEIQGNIADKMCNMVDVLGGKNCDFNIQGFDMINMKSVGTSWRQPDAAAGTANILYYAYKIFNNEKYLTYAKYCMDYLENLNYNPYYENMLIDASYVAAMMNAEAGTDYDVSRYLNWITGSSSVRRGWGGVNYSMNGTDVTGLTGNGNNGYAFFFNSVYPMTSILPTAKYDPSYAKMAGKWALNIVSNARYFLPDELDASHQTNAEYKDTLEGSVLAYEGFKKTANGSDIGVSSGTSLVGTGDAKANATSGWKAGENATNLGIYGSVYTGIMGALIEPTNVDNILKLDCNKTDYYQNQMYPTYLYYNPNSEAKEVEIQLDDTSDIFDSVTGKYLAKNVSGIQKIKLLADSARVIVLAPANSTVNVENGITTINGKLVSRSDADVLPDAGTEQVSEIAVSGDEAINQKGASASYTATVKPENVEDDRVVWSVTNPDGSETDKAVIDKNGTLTVAKNGRVVVKASAVDGSGIIGEKTVTISRQTLPSLSQNKETKTSSHQDGFDGNLAVDGNDLTRWIANAKEEHPWISVDLGAEADITQIVLNWEAARPPKYDVQISNNGEDWRTIHTEADGGNSAKIVTVTVPENTVVKYVRVYTQQKSKWGCSMYEMDVYGNFHIDKQVESINVTSENSSNEITTKNRALQMNAEIMPNDSSDKRVEWYVYNTDGSETKLAEITSTGQLKPLANGTVKVVASAVDGSGVTGEAIVEIKNQDVENLALNKAVSVSNAEGGNPKEGLNDGKESTRWASGKSGGHTEWAMIDLGESSYINKVVLNWEAAYGVKYKIQGSQDGETFFDLAEESNGQGGIKEFSFEEREVRYVRMQGVQTRPGLGYSLWEFEVYGRKASAVTPGTEKTIGTVAVNGNSSFDSDSIMNNDADQWRWLSYPESRIVTNYGKRNDKAKYDGGMNLDLALAVNGFQTKNSLHKVQMGPKDGSVGDYKKLETAWYPYKLTADASYETGKLHMDEFFADKDTFVRLIEVSDASDAKLKMSGRISGITKSGDDLLVEQRDYWMVYKFLKLDNDGKVTGQYTPTVKGEDWSVETTFDNATEKLAFSLTLLPKKVEGNSSERTLQLAEQTTGANKNLNKLLKNTKAYWDGLLAKVPAPQSFGVKGNASNGTISAEAHRKSFYAAWAFQYQNIVEPTPEKEYDYYQVTLGLASTWSHGAASAPNSCSWESLFDIQEISYVEPDIAWNAMEGFIYSIDDNGILDGECLPSQKAHTVWVCYENMIKAHPEQKAELNEKLADLYSYVRKYLVWRADNPRWIYGGENFANEKDISFVTQWYSDVNYAIKIANMLGKYDDVAMFEQMKTEMGEQAREWFSAEYDPEQPESRDNRIMAFCFLGADGKNNYSWSGSSHNAKSDDALNYVYEAIFADFPKDLTDKLVHSYLAFIDGHEDEPLLGFKFYKYGDGAHTAYGLLEKEAEYPELAGKWEEYVDAILANAIKNVDFAECLRVGGNTTHLEGVEPSSFTASAVIDYTYMKNGMRIDMGEPVSLGGSSLTETENTDIDIYTIKGTKPELPKTVSVDNAGEEIQALVVWPEVKADQYDSDKTEFTVEGKIYGTNLKATATVHVYNGNVTIQDQKYTTMVGSVVTPETIIPAVYTDNGAQHHAVVEVKWDEVKEDMVSKAGTVTLDGTILFNGQKVTAEIKVVKGPAIVAENDVIDKYDTMKLSVKNQDDPDKQYRSVSWSIVDGGYDAAAGISEQGTLLAVKAGQVTVQADVVDENGEKITIQKTFTIRNKNIVSDAYGARVSASSTDGSSSAEMAVDTKENTWWRAANNSDNQWFQMELSDVTPISGAKIRWYEGNQPHSVKVLVSEDGENWEEVYARTQAVSSGRDNYSEIIVLDGTKTAKYVRMESSKAGDNRTGIVEFEVYSQRNSTVKVKEISISADKDSITEKGGNLKLQANILPDQASEKRVIWSVTDMNGNETDIASIRADGTLEAKKNGVVLVKATAADGSNVTGEKQIQIKNQDIENIALNKQVSAGTQGSGNEAYKAVDGDSSTRYGSAQHPGANWFQVDLGGEYEIHTVAIDFESARAIDFKIQISDDGEKWTTVKDVTDNKTLNWRYTLSNPMKAHYVKIDVSKTSNAEWGFSMYEFQVYGREAVNLNLSELQKVITKAEEVDSEKYTEESNLNLAKALADAKALLTKEDATQSEVDEMAKILQKALDNLEEIVVPEPVDTKELEETIEAAKKIEAEGYTTASYQALQKVILEAEELSENPTDQEAVDAMTEKLAKAVKDLVKKADTTALQAVIAQAEVVDSEKYTEESNKNLAKALADAKALLTKEDATQSEVDEMTETLQKALNNLEEIVVPEPVDTKELEETIEAAKKIEAEGYTTASYQALQKVILEAEELSENPTDQEAVDAMTEKLAKAVKNLVKKADDSEKFGDTNKNPGDKNQTSGTNQNQQTPDTNNQNSGNKTGILSPKTDDVKDVAGFALLFGVAAVTAGVCVRKRKVRN